MPSLMDTQYASMTREELVRELHNKQMVINWHVSRLTNPHHYRVAASMALDGKGLMYLLDRGLYADFRRAFGWPGVKLSGELRCLALCFMAAMAEAGDA
jgi:hypothetical protein